MGVHVVLKRTVVTDYATPSTDKHYSLDSEDDFRSGCRNVSHQQQFFSELPSPGRSHNTYELLILLGSNHVLNIVLFPWWNLHELRESTRVFSTLTYITQSIIKSSYVQTQRALTTILKHNSVFAKLHGLKKNEQIFASIFLIEFNFKISYTKHFIATRFMFYSFLWVVFKLFTSWTRHVLLNNSEHKLVMLQCLRSKEWST